MQEYCFHIQTAAFETLTSQLQICGRHPAAPNRMLETCWNPLKWWDKPWNHLSTLSMKHVDRWFIRLFIRFLYVSISINKWHLATIHCISGSTAAPQKNLGLRSNGVFESLRPPARTRSALEIAPCHGRGHQRGDFNLRALNEGEVTPSLTNFKQKLEIWK